MEQLVFLVKGSAAEPYEVTFIKDGDSLTAICTCPAGQYGNSCKHRLAIFDGDTSAVTSNNAARANDIVSWLHGTDVESALAELRSLEASSGIGRDELATAKKKLARAMNT
jgi:uncharacterized Zn finger protein